MKWNLMEGYVKLILAGFDLHEGEVYVSESFLLFLGMPNTVRSLVSHAKGDGQGNWKSRINNGKLYILHSSIPDRTRQKLNLNFPLDYLKDLLVTHRGIDDKSVLNEIKAESYLMIRKEVANYQKYLPTFYELYQTKEERVTQAINFAILNVIVSYTKKYPRGLIDHFYEVLKNEKIASHSIPVDSKNYFYKYIRRTIRVGLPQALVNGNKGKASNNLKLTDTLKELIIFLKSFGNYTSCREIEQNLKTLRANPKIGEEIKQVSESAIRNYLATTEADNLTLLVRQGYRRFEERILGYLPLSRTKDPLTKILIDGYIIQVVCKGENHEPVKLVLFTIMDTFSGFVVMEIGDVEDYLLIRRTFEKFLKFTRFKMPREVVSDMHSSIQSKHFVSFREYLEGNGVHWEVSPNPKRKAQLERWFGTLQQVYLTRITGYIGEGIKSRRKDAHPSEEIQFIIKQTELLKDKDELTRLILAAGDDYNRNAHFKNAASPLDLYHLKKPIHFLQLQDYHLPYFFWDRHEVTIRGSMIIIKSTIDGKSKKWFYRRADYDFAKLNSSKVNAFHNPMEEEFLYLFEKDSLKFIGRVDIQLIANEAIMDQTEHDKKIIADFGISKANLHQAFTSRLEEIETSLKSKFGIDPEQLRLEANFKKEADEYLGYQIGIVQKTPEVNLSKPYKQRKGRRAVKKSTARKSRIFKLAIHDTMG